MKMLHNNVLLTEAEQSTTTAGGIILTADIDKAVKPGIVLSVSETVASIMPELMVGVEVYLNWKESMPVTIDGQKAAIIDAKHIKCII